MSGLSCAILLCTGFVHIDALPHGHTLLRSERFVESDGEQQYSKLQNDGQFSSDPSLQNQAAEIRVNSTVFEPLPDVASPLQEPIQSSARATKVTEDIRENASVQSGDSPFLQGLRECMGRKQVWVEEGGVRRLKGPVIHIHTIGLYNVAGRTVEAMAELNGMPGQMFARWGHLDGSENFTDANGTKINFDPWKDRSWTDLEADFGSDSNSGLGRQQHTLDDLGCGTNKAILSIATRHPLNMILAQHLDVCKHTDQPNPQINCKQKFGAPGVAVWQPGPNNFMVRALAGKQCDPGPVFEDNCAPLSQDDVELAKFRASRMDLIFIVEHLNMTMQLGRTRLGWNVTSLPVELHKHEEKENQKLLHHFTPQDRQVLEERNKQDIELYEYMRERAFDMLRHDRLPVPTKEDVRKGVPQEIDKLLVTAVETELP